MKPIISVGRVFKQKPSHTRYKNTMNKICPTLVILLTLLLLSSCAALQGASSSASREDVEDYVIRPSSVIAADNRKERDIRREIKDLEESFALRIRVRVFNDTALLIGEIQTSQAKDRLTAIARRVGVEGMIFNQVEVYNSLPKYSGFDDVLLGTRVRFVFAGVRELDTTRVRYMVDRKKIYLMGIFTTEESDILVDALSGISGVEEIVVLFDFKEIDA